PGRPTVGTNTSPYTSLFRSVSILLCGPRHPADFYLPNGEGDEMDFFDVKGVVETLLERLGFKMQDVEFVARPDTETFGPRCAEVDRKSTRLNSSRVQISYAV